MFSFGDNDGLLFTVAGEWHVESAMRVVFDAELDMFFDENAYD